MKWLQRHPVAVNLALSFAGATCASMWTNYFTGDGEMRDRQHLLLALAVGALILQYWFNQREAAIERSLVERIRGQAIGDLLGFGLRFVIAHAKAPITIQEIRVIVHLREQASPGTGYALQACLVPRYWKSPVLPRDYGAIPLEVPAYQAWYANVKAYHKQRVQCEEPNLNARPDDPKAHVNTPSLFESTSVLSAPIWSRADGQPKVIGTMTFDSKRTMEDLNWCAQGAVSQAMRETLDALADAVGEALTHDETRI